MEFGYDKLLGRIKEKCGTQEKLAMKLGINPVTMCVKLKNRGGFNFHGTDYATIRFLASCLTWAVLDQP